MARSPTSTVGTTKMFFAARSSRYPGFSVVFRS
jgi:hypothetical protein